MRTRPPVRWEQLSVLVEALTADGWNTERRVSVTSTLSTDAGRTLGSQLLTSHGSWLHPHRQVVYGALRPVANILARFGLQELSSRQICLAKYATYRAKYLVELRQLAHLVSQT